MSPIDTRFPPHRDREAEPTQPTAPARSSAPAQSSPPGPLKILWDFFDIFCMALSPMAALGVVVFGIIAADYWGEHLTWLQTLDAQGVEATGRVAAYSPGDTSFLVVFDPPSTLTPEDSAFLYTKYYSADTLSTLKNDDVVRVRYPANELENHAILADHYNEVRFWNAFQGAEWPLIFCLVMLAMQPSVLYLGLDLEIGTKKNPSAPGANPVKTAANEVIDSAKNLNPANMREAQERRRTLQEQQRARKERERLQRYEKRLANKEARRRYRS